MLSRHLFEQSDQQPQKLQFDHLPSLSLRGANSLLTP